ncbi:MAG: YggS family pyridoxal phosphate-dependent enzyme [Ruminococcus sp.]|jgi:pyridoxal phosphate enzyme (YggS family)|nr:YggS family pyridoxal phosphate-dependent enzyme [Ruminococcus sp.]
MSLSENYKRISYEIAEAKARYRSNDEKVRLMAVTKTVPPEIVNEAIALGIDLLGENRVQEFLSKKDSYSPAEIHFIGSLQSNKVRKIIELTSMIHSVDSVSLADEINRQSTLAKIKTDVLIEINIGDEDSKSGVLLKDFDSLAEHLISLQNINLRGIMVIPPPGNEEYFFAKTKDLFDKTKEKYNTFDTLSMGMSGDFKEAIKHGSNIVRVGSALFGARI